MPWVMAAPQSVIDQPDPHEDPWNCQREQEDTGSRRQLTQVFLLGEDLSLPEAWLIQMVQGGGFFKQGLEIGIVDGFLSSGRFYRPFD